jgi:hypothetical protein
MITQLIVWVVMAYGITNIVVYGSIFNGPREGIRKWSESNLPLNSFAAFIRDMTSCPMCFSTWFGFFAGIFVYSPIHEILGFTKYGSWFFDGMLCSGSVWAINSIIEWFEENRPQKHN